MKDYKTRMRIDPIHKALDIFVYTVTPILAIVFALCIASLWA